MCLLGLSGDVDHLDFSVGNDVGKNVAVAALVSSWISAKRWGADSHTLQLVDQGRTRWVFGADPTTPAVRVRPPASTCGPPPLEEAN